MFTIHPALRTGVIVEFSSRISKARSRSRLKKDPQHQFRYCIHGHQGGVILYFFALFEKQHVSADQVYFYRYNSKRSANFAARERVVRAVKFSFLKYCRNLKKYFFFVHLQKPFLYIPVKKQSPKRKFKIKIYLKNCFFPKCASGGLCKQQENYFQLLKNQRIHSPMSQASKTLVKKMLC